MCLSYLSVEGGNQRKHVKFTLDVEVMVVDTWQESHWERERESWFWKYDCRSTTESLHDDGDDEPEIVLEILCWCVHLSADHGRPLSLIAGAQPGPNSQVIALQLALPPPLLNTSSTKQEKNTPGFGARLDHASPWNCLILYTFQCVSCNRALQCDTFEVLQPWPSCQWWNSAFV